MLFEFFLKDKSAFLFWEKKHQSSQNDNTYTHALAAKKILPLCDMYYIISRFLIFVIFFILPSSVLAFIGMILGRLLGDLDNVTPWIFTATAGIFLYVALVDMIPELNSGHAHPYTSKEQNESKATELCLQVSTYIVCHDVAI